MAKNTGRTFWLYDGRQFFNKNSALESAGDISRVSFHHHDEAFSKANWLVEPEKSWPDLLCERACQLRDSYDHLRLWYSGGVDSHTVLMTFIENKIPLDEICIMRTSPTADYEDPGNSEINFVALPFLRRIQPLLGKAKINLLDLGPRHYQKFFSDPDWAKQVNTIDFRLSYVSTASLLLPELISPIERGRKLANVTGGNKPRLEMENGRYYAFYWDEYLKWDLNEATRESLEEFYFSSELPEVHIKQCHMVKNHLKAKHPEMTDLKEFFRNDHPVYVNELNSIVRLPAPGGVSLGKSSTLLTPKAAYQLQQAREGNEEVFLLYQRRLEELESFDQWRFNNGHISSGFIGIKSQRYDLGA